MIELPDATFIIQIVGFLVFWQLMKRMLFTPVQAALAIRSARTIGDRDRAQTLQLEVDGLAAEVEAKLLAARAAGARAADDARRKGEAEAEAVLERHRAEAAALLERERAAIDVAVREARAPLRGTAERLASGVIAKVLGRAA